MAKAPFFWYGNSFVSRICAKLFAPLGEMYGEAAINKLSLSPTWRSPIPVICVGNATSGGSGKSPITKYIRKALSNTYDKPTVLLRGYGGNSVNALQVNPGMDSAVIAGDEAILHSRNGPTIISTNRALGARLALAQGADLIIMDDGLQNRDLYQDVRILVIAVDTGFGNELCIPAGPLRAPINYTLEHCDIIIANGDETKSGWVKAIGERHNIPVFCTTPTLKGFTSDILTKPVVAYAGTAFPERFFNNLIEYGVKLIHAEPLGDHVFPDNKTCSRILNLAAKNNAVIVTTEKDIARLQGSKGLQANLLVKSKHLTYEVNMPEVSKFIQWLEALIVLSRNDRMQPSLRNKLPENQQTNNAILLRE